MPNQKDPATVLHEIVFGLGADEEDFAQTSYGASVILAVLVREPETVGAFAGALTKFAQDEWANLLPDEEECTFVVESMRSFLERIATTRSD